ncbi:hypothetical protein [Bifidobacterium panos]|uniref:Uncharacterized protein n=1 Tax=Bifidobacterium panos TaxID=2675321 RepID=A0ABX1T163_9BIFI|nr:hypothetical protein [Bifidobacterium sp. DSM 109963]NMN02767.1 hypothetical protein [Bifidobacterium sp. DSM 109963]
MRITDSIFREIDSFGVDEFLGTDYDSEEYEERRGILDELKAREHGYTDYASLTDEQRDEVDEDEILVVCRFDRYGLLADALRLWYGSFGVILEHVRSAYDGGDGYIYYVTGIGYDTIGSDLLGGEADGTMAGKFLDFINEHE